LFKLIEYYKTQSGLADVILAGNNDDPVITEAVIIAQWENESAYKNHKGPW